MASALHGGEVIFLSGPLGAGKTALVQAIGRGLDIKHIISSPTYVMVKEYSTTFGTLVHADLYRLASYEGVSSLGVIEQCGHKSTVVVIEWPENVTQLELIPHLHFQFNIGPTSRTVTIAQHGASPINQTLYQQLLKAHSNAKSVD